MDEIILKYLKRELDIEDQHKLTKWLEEDELNERVLRKLERYWKGQHVSTERAKTEIWNRLADHIDRHQQQYNRTGRLHVAGSFLRVAAILAIIFFLSFLMFRYSGNGHDVVVEQVRYLEKVSLYGQKINIQLPDGSKVKLNAGSKLIVPEKFTGNTREVELIGEAYFEITRDVERPFIVRSGDLDISVLGTSFNVRAYPEEADIRVAVNTGKVAVRQKNQEERMVLVPDEMAIYTTSRSTTHKEKFDRKAVFSWKDKTLFFDKAGIDEVLLTLERWYGVQFRVNRRLDDKRDFSGEYHNKSLEAVLSGLSYIYRFEYEIHDDIVTIN